MSGLSRFLGLVLVTAALATAGGALFALVDDGTTLARSIASGFWIAAAVALVGMLLASSNRLARRFDLPYVEGRLFLTAAVLFTVVGAVVDVLGA